MVPEWIRQGLRQVWLGVFEVLKEGAQQRLPWVPQVTTLTDVSPLGEEGSQAVEIVQQCGTAERVQAGRAWLCRRGYSE